MLKLSVLVDQDASLRNGVPAPRLAIVEITALDIAPWTAADREAVGGLIGQSGKIPDFVKAVSCLMSWGVVPHSGEIAQTGIMLEVSEPTAEGIRVASVASRESARRKQAECAAAYAAAVSRNAVGANEAMVDSLWAFACRWAEAEARRRPDDKKTPLV